MTVQGLQMYCRLILAEKIGFAPRGALEVAETREENNQLKWIAFYNPANRNYRYEYLVEEDILSIEIRTKKVVLY